MQWSDYPDIAKAVHAALASRMHKLSVLAPDTSALGSLRAFIVESQPAAKTADAENTAVAGGEQAAEKTCDAAKAVAATSVAAKSVAPNVVAANRIAAIVQ